jgi:hypothetical protein
LFLKCNPNDIQEIVFNIHVGPFWEANIDAHFISDPYTTIVMGMKTTKTSRFSN